MRHVRLTGTLVIASMVAAANGSLTRVEAQPGVTAGYVAVGDSIEFGLGDDMPLDGIGYVEPFGTFLSMALNQTVEVHNFSVPRAQARDILLAQLPAALAAARRHQPVVVSWGGGGNDVARVGTTPQAAACRHTPSCLGRFGGLLNEAESAIDRTIARLRTAVGSQGRILMRTQYNALARSGCAPPEIVALGNAVLEGIPGTVLDRGLNDRIRAIAAKHGAEVVELFVPFAFSPDTFVAADCVHPSGAGYDAILSLFQATYLLGP